MLVAIFLAACLSSLNLLCKGMPHAIVHIGPHKTSSSHLQAFISTHTSILEPNNLYWPREQNGQPFSAKRTAGFAFALRNNSNDPLGTIKTVQDFLDDSLHRGRNVVLSSEEFDAMREAGIRQLGAMLKGFKVSIVHVYRELLSHMISLYFEINRFEHGIQFSEPFSAFLLKHIDKVNVILDPMPLLKSYADVFGNDSIKVIDLSGCMAAGVDVTYVLICEIAGVLCDRPEAFKAGDLGSNSAYSLLPAQVFSFYNAYVEKQHNYTCRHCDSLYTAYQRFSTILSTEVAAHRAPWIPTIRSNLGLLIPFAEKLDAMLRATYGNKILHGNVTSNQQDMRSRVHAESLDVPAFVRSPEWDRWMHAQFKADKMQGRLCGCVGKGSQDRE